jgi:hypothetical protein
MPVHQERRRTDTGGILCDNDVLRLRVVSTPATLAMIIEARNANGAWTSLASTVPLAQGMPAPALRCHVAEPLLEEGEVTGVRLSGTVEHTPVTLSVRLNPDSNWCQVQLGADSASSALSSTWYLAPEFGQPDICWPAPAVDPLEAPAAFYQAGAHFIAMLPPFDDVSPRRDTLQCSGAEEMMALMFRHDLEGDQAEVMPGRCQLTYALCADARALHCRGFQEIVRAQGTHDALLYMTPALGDDAQGDRPPLPAAPDTSGWVPFMTEGTPAQITAFVRHALTGVENAQWYLLDDALCWLDRLCFQQRIYETPGGLPFGSFSHGPSWEVAALWLPEVLLQAFRATGIAEYAYRAIAALAALPSHQYRPALGQLYEQYGDLYIHLDALAVFSLTGAEATQVAMLPNGLMLTVNAAQAGDPVRLVIDGSEDGYTLVINGECYGYLPITLLREGILVN